MMNLTGIVPGERPLILSDRQILELFGIQFMEVHNESSHAEDRNGADERVDTEYLGR